MTILTGRVNDTTFPNGIYYDGHWIHCVEEDDTVDSVMLDGRFPRRKVIIINSRKSVMPVGIQRIPSGKCIFSHGRSASVLRVVKRFLLSNWDRSREYAT